MSASAQGPGRANDYVGSGAISQQGIKLTPPWEVSSTTSRQLGVRGAGTGGQIVGGVVGS
jgi:hypothetical protein